MEIATAQTNMAVERIAHVPINAPALEYLKAGFQTSFGNLNHRITA